MKLTRVRFEVEYDGEPYMQYSYDAETEGGWIPHAAVDGAIRCLATLARIYPGFVRPTPEETTE